MGDHELEQELRPGAAADLGGPVGQGVFVQALRQLAPAEGPVDDHRAAMLRRQGQQLAAAVVEVIPGEELLEPPHASEAKTL